MSFRINYKLKNPNEIAPWGEETKSLSWFGLTDGLLWITAGKDTIYEYADTEEAWDFWCSRYIEHGIPLPRKKSEIFSQYNDYQLARFVEDFIEILPAVVQSVPETLYRSIGTFREMTDRWLAQHDGCADEEFNSFYDNSYCRLMEWYNSRTLDSGHLVGGPTLGFFRCGDKITFIWHSTHRLPSGGSIWTSPSGIYEMDYNSFHREVFHFFRSFALDMYNQMIAFFSDVLEGKLKGVDIDMDAVAREQQQREQTLCRSAHLLSCDKKDDTDWDRVCALFDLMKSEISD